MAANFSALMALLAKPASTGPDPDLSTAKYDSNVVVVSYYFVESAANTPNCARWSADGSEFFISSYDGVKGVVGFDTTAPFDTASATPNGNNLVLTGCREFTFAGGGTILYVASLPPTPTVINQYALSTPYDLSTASFVGSKSFGFRILGFDVAADGMTAILLRQAPKRIERWSFGSAFDITTITDDADYFSLPIAVHEGLKISPSEKRLYITSLSGVPGGYVREYLMTAPLTPSTITHASGVAEINPSDICYAVSGIDISPDGTKILVAGHNFIGVNGSEVDSRTVGTFTCRTH